MDHGVAGRRREGPVRGLEAGRGGSLRAGTRHLCEGARSAIPPRGLQPVLVEYVLAGCGETRKYVIPHPVRCLNGVRNLFFPWLSCEQTSLTRKRQSFGMTNAPFSAAC